LRRGTRQPNERRGFLPRLLVEPAAERDPQRLRGAGKGGAEDADRAGPAGLQPVGEREGLAERHLVETALGGLADEKDEGQLPGSLGGPPEQERSGLPPVPLGLGRLSLPGEPLAVEQEVVVREAALNRLQSFIGAVAQPRVDRVRDQGDQHVQLVVQTRGGDDDRSEGAVGRKAEVLLVQTDGLAPAPALHLRVGWGRRRALLGCLPRDRRLVGPGRRRPPLGQHDGEHRGQGAERQG